jgi:hypothetical protein
VERAVEAHRAPIVPPRDVRRRARRAPRATSAVARSLC